jgi:hypothetical protein
MDLSGSAFNVWLGRRFHRVWGDPIALAAVSVSKVIDLILRPFAKTKGLEGCSESGGGAKIHWNRPSPYTKVPVVLRGLRETFAFLVFILFTTMDRKITPRSQCWNFRAQRVGAAGGQLRTRAVGF